MEAQISEKSWTCGDCRTRYPMSVLRCARPFDDYLALRGGSIESAITRAVEKAIAPIAEAAAAHLRPNREPSYFAIAA